MTRESLWFRPGALSRELGARGRATLAAGAAVALVGLSLFLVRDHTRGDSLSIDEPIHILAGYFQVSRLAAVYNIEHPPLAKELAGLALLSLPLDPPAEPGKPWNRFPPITRRFLFENGVPADRLIAAARAPFLALWALLLCLVFQAARSRCGNAPALFALALAALDPNLLAHAGVVHTDLGAAVGFFASVLAWDAARRRPSVGRFVLASLCLGLALAMKFSAVLLFPILLLQCLVADDRSSSLRRPGLGRVLLSLAAVVAGALLTVLALYALVTYRLNSEVQRQILEGMLAPLSPRLTRALLWLAQRSKPLAHYFGGLVYVLRQDSTGEGLTYLFGRVSSGSPSYFFVAFAVKSAPAMLAVTALLAAGLARQSSAARRCAGLLLLPVAVLFVASVRTSYNVGIRHLLPVYPFLALAGAEVFAEAWHARHRHGRARAAAWLLAVLPLSGIAEICLVHPHELSYFNALAGGPAGGRRVLSDSNADWGLDLKRLAAELARRGVVDPTVVYFGGDDVAYRIGVPDFFSDPQRRGSTVAISVFHETLGVEFNARYGSRALATKLQELLDEIARRGRAVGRIGYSIDLFELPRNR